MRLKDKVALVTGASHGIGRGIALRFAQEGAKVAVNYFTGEQNAADAVRLIREGGGEAEMYQGDTSDTPRMREIIAAVVERFGRLDIYVNNANAGRRVPGASRSYLDVSEEQLFEGRVRQRSAGGPADDRPGRRRSDYQHYLGPPGASGLDLGLDLRLDEGSDSPADR